MSDTSDTRDQVESAVRDFVAASESGDAAAMAGVYGPQAQLLPAGRDVVQGTVAIQGFWQDVIDMGLKDAEVDIVELDACGDTAIEVGRYKFIAAAGEAAESGKYIVIWKSENGRLRIHREMWTTNEAPV